jgi:large subunit ribosomal protein L4
VKIQLVNTQGQRVGDIELDDSVFGAPVKNHLFYEVVKMQLANRRRGTHSTKDIDEVSGTGKKPYRQKGTGRARHGNNRAVQMRKGAVAHGPHPRDYSYSVGKKVMQGALRSALSLRTSESKLHVIQGWKPAAPKTQEAKAVLAKLECNKALVVDSSSNETLKKSIRNLAHARFIPVDALNVYDILAHDHLILSDAAVAHLVSRLKTTASRKERGAVDSRQSTVDSKTKKAPAKKAVKGDA